MNIAFYAPMKPPDHPTPSGDRLIAQLLLEALRKAGHAPTVAARFRSYEGRGDASRQRRLKAVAQRLAVRLISRLQALPPGSRPRCWFTYHLYHKAPDWIGPAAARALKIPYVVVEASLAPKQAAGPWRQGHLDAAEAIAGADLVVSLNRSDMPCLQPMLSDRGRLVYRQPFLDLNFAENQPGDAGSREQMASKHGISDGVPWLITVAMMRSGNKLDSYRVLAQALGARERLPWQLLLVGDGPVRSQVEAAFRVLDPARVSFLGALPREEIAVMLRACDLFLWPAVAEPLGMAMLEAHAAGLAVVAGDSGGVSDIVRHGETGLLTPPGDPKAFAAAVDLLLGDAGMRRSMGTRARALARSEHSLEAASADLDRWLRPLCPGSDAA